MNTLHQAAQALIEHWDRNGVVNNGEPLMTKIEQLRAALAEEEAKHLKQLKGAIRSDGGLLVSGSEYLSWTTEDGIAELDGLFDADELAAIAWWMAHKPPEHEVKP